MNDVIWAALIAAIASIIGNLIVSRRSARKMDQKMEIRQAVTDTKIEELTREVREHNNFARRMPVVEEQISELKGSVNTLKHYHME